MNQDDVFQTYRSLLFSIAYRMLGSVMDAEDCVQEAYVSWHQTVESGESVQSPKAYLCTIVTRLCIDQLRAARAQREAYVGVWLPEPLVEPNARDLAEMAALSESLSMAFLLLLEHLSPVERAVFLLHQVFDYEYAEIATMVRKSEEHCRQNGAMAHHWPAALSDKCDQVGQEAGKKRWCKEESSARTYACREIAFEAIDMSLHGPGCFL